MALAIENLLKEEEKILKFSKLLEKMQLIIGIIKKVAKSHINFYKNILNYE